MNGKRIFLVKGRDARLIQDAEAEIRGSLKEKENLDEVFYDGTNCDINDVVMSLDQNYIFSDGAIVIVRNVAEMASDLQNQLATYVENTKSSSVFANYLILTSATGAIGQKLSKAASNVGEVLDTTIGDAKARSSFVADELKASSLNYAPDVVRFLSSHFGEDVSRVRSLIEVLESTYGTRKRLETDDVEPYVNSMGSRPIFEATNALEDGSLSPSEVVTKMGQFIDVQGVHPLALLSLISRRVLEYVAVAGRIRTLDDLNTALEDAGLKRRDGFPAKKLFEVARGLKPSDARLMLRYVTEAESAMKGRGGVSDRFAFELMVARVATTLRSRMR
ncbi:MAG: hypothetical protein M0019_01260 [Actinomycetota bacterium]|nr:hypothetical protein [Actinomycetota bacterium]